MKVYVNLLYFPVKVLGPGERVGLWLQGCTIRCKGCMSNHTWEFEDKYLMEVEHLVEKINQLPSDKLTVSGGEPFDQPQALQEILKGVRKTKKDILVYTGYSYRKVESNWKDILNYADVLITEAFVEGMDTDLIWKGSDNQMMIILNKELEANYLKFMKEKKTKTLQIAKSEGFIHLLGIPYQKDLKELYKLYMSQ